MIYHLNLVAVPNLRLVVKLECLQGAYPMIHRHPYRRRPVQTTRDVVLQEVHPSLQRLHQCILYLLQMQILFFQRLRQSPFHLLRLYP